MTHAPTREPSSVQAWALLAALAVVFVWSACSVVIKATGSASPPFAYAALRALIAAAALLALAGPSGRLRLPRSEWAWVVVFGLANTTLGLSAMFVSVRLTGAPLPAVLANSQALLVAPLAALFFRERLTWVRMSGLAIGLIGVALIMAGTPGGAGNLAGVVISLMAAAGLAGGNLIIKYLDGRVDPLTAVAWHYLIGAIPLVAWSVMAEDWMAIEWSGPFIGAVLFLGVAGSAGATYVWYRLVQVNELIRLNALTLLIPFFSIILALAMYDEPLGMAAAAGSALVIAGVVGVAWPGSSIAERRSSD